MLATVGALAPVVGIHLRATGLVMGTTGGEMETGPYSVRLNPWPKVAVAISKNAMIFIAVLLPGEVFVAGCLAIQAGGLRG
jgi:hypothetical protein